MTTDPMSQGQAVVQITLGQVYSEVMGARQDVRDLKGSMVGVVSVGTDHEARIRVLERRMWIAIGMGTVAGAAASAAITLWASAH